MARYVARVETTRPPAEAFAYMSDFTNTREWDPSVTDARSDTEQPGLGSVFRLQYAMLGRSIELVYRVTAFDPPQSITLECETRLMSLTDRIEVSARPGGALVTYDATITLPGLLRLADPLLALGFTRNGDAARDGLRRAIGT